MNRRIITETDLRRRLSLNVRALRTKAGYTLKRVSARAEMHWRHWQKIEAGETNATLATVVKMADALDVDPNELLREAVSEPASPSGHQQRQQSP
jgi:transcriptional regulator with XRE-family HTH domain